jgi:hypothetical protein
MKKGFDKYFFFKVQEKRSAKMRYRNAKRRGRGGNARREVAEVVP